MKNYIIFVKDLLKNFLIRENKLKKYINQD